ncbi:MAG: PaaX family transcriptional regulator [Actinomycetota bacterium]|nr:PaaX family transcriptional regulator [Actinomycetota bacterium]MDQ3307276.1 PaaX family transcriptional regulator [Actinomycetota bacterium]
MNARSALFDVYGDHLRPRGGAAPVAALVRLMGALDIAAPAVRTAISRMVRQRWLAPVKTTTGPGYQLTPRAEHRLTDAAARIYRSGIAPWDGRWHLLVLAHVPVRATRERVRTGLSYLGYAPLRDDTWVSPRSSTEVDALLTAEGVQAHRFHAFHEGEAIGLTATAWDLDALGDAYACWLEEARVLAAQASDRPTDRDAFVVRSLLVHEWRKFLFRDPGLPSELLPKRWPGHQAAAFFDSEASRLLPAAGRYVEACLQPNGEP